MSDVIEADVTPIEPESPAPRRSPLRRIGCGILLTVWFLLLLLPCPIVYLATQGEITISTGSAPGQQLRVWLMTEDQNRGFGLSTAAVVRSDDQPNEICVQTDVRYFMWAGQGEDVAYCECYARADADAAWSPTDTSAGACAAP